MDYKCSIGTCVVALAGRDKGKYFVVCALPEDGYAYIADGKTHKLQAPKKKKFKHIKPVAASGGEAVTLEIKPMMSNRMLRKQLCTVISQSAATDQRGGFFWLKTMLLNAKVL